LSSTPAQPDPLAGLAADASFFPQRIDFLQETVLLIRMSRDAYFAASFLDDRILTTRTQGAWVPHARVAEAMADAPGKPLHFIFHAGHVGSTLISRLLDETGLVQPLREPQTLRQLAEASDVLDEPASLLSALQFDRWLTTQIRLWRRGFPADRAVVLKATSSAARLGGRLLAALPDAKAIHLNLAAEPYLATLLAGPNSPIDLRGMGGERLRRLAGMLGGAPGALHEMSLGELAAMTWLAERLTQLRLSAECGHRLRALDFDRFLGDVSAQTQEILAHFGLPPPAGYLEKLPASAALTRYSKAPEHAYSPALRAEILAESRADNAAEIRRGMAWLERLAAARPEVASAL
jgi:hypothetical protein